MDTHDLAEENTPRSLAQEAAEHEVAMRNAKLLAGVEMEEAYRAMSLFRFAPD